MKSKVSLSDLNLIDKTEIDVPKKIKFFSLKKNNDKNFQPGGETFAWMYMNSFLKKRHKGYTKNISSPIYSRISCSRLSPYITYGNLSSKQVYQFFF
jgi:deoxyribodipyrimidine photo-lyase